MNDEIRKKKVALYIRVSTEEQAEMYGVELQKSALMSLIAAKSQTFEFAGEDYVYIDEGVSGSLNPLEREKFSKLVEDIGLSAEDRPFDVVAVYKIDRFARRLKLLLEIIDIFEKREDKIEFISVNESIDTSTPFGRAMLGILGVISELELETIKERTIGGRAASAADGVFLNVPPLGYIKDDRKRIVIQKEEANVVKMIFNLCVVDRLGTHEIAQYLMQHKVLSPQAYRYRHKKEDKGSRKLSLSGDYSWDSSTVRRILRDELYIGNQYYDKSKGGKKVPKEEWKVIYHNQAIIDKEIFAKAQNILNKSRRAFVEKKNDTRIYLLQGLLKCANCYNPVLHSEPYAWNGSPHIVKSTGNRSYYYSCSTKNSVKKSKRQVTCSSLPLSAEQLENHVVDFLWTLLDSPKVVFRYQQELQSKKIEVKNCKDRLRLVNELLNSMEQRKKNVVDSFVSAHITKKDRDERLLKLKGDKIRLLKEKSSLESDISVFANTSEYIKAFEIFKDKYSEAMKKYAEEVTIEPDSLYSLIHMMVEEIVVFSRPRRKTDKISGRKKEGQMIPYKLKIVLRIPAEMLSDLLYSLSPEDKLRAKKRGWWAIPESNQ